MHAGLVFREGSSCSQRRSHPRITRATGSATREGRRVATMTSEGTDDTKSRLVGGGETSGTSEVQDWAMNVTLGPGRSRFEG